MKIASIEKILSVESHPNADRLDVVKVLGYQCIAERDLHKEGDLVIYIQPDSILPTNAEWAEGYRKYSPGRIKAVKLRGEWSEGIIVKQEQIPGFNRLCLPLEREGHDVAEILGVTHYEPPLPQDLSAKGLLPLGIPKTDEERWENMVEKLPIGFPVDITLKVDGQSWSAYYNFDTKEFGVLGRTMEYKETTHNKYTAQINRYDIKRRLISFCEKYEVSLCIRGESYGSGIQSFNHNPYSKENAGLAIFSVYLISERRYARPGDKFYFIDVCQELDLPTVPILERDIILTQEIIEKYSTSLKKIDDKPFEGVVVNHGAYSIRTNIALNLPNVCEVHRTAEYSPNSFKIINKNYDANK